MITWVHPVDALNARRALLKAAPSIVRADDPLDSSHLGQGALSTPPSTLPVSRRCTFSMLTSAICAFTEISPDQLLSCSRPVVAALTPLPFIPVASPPSVLSVSFGACP